VRKYGQREFGNIVNVGELRHANERKALTVDAKDRVALELDAVDVGGNDRWRERNAEAQGPVSRGQREKMRDHGSATVFGQSFDGVGDHGDFGPLAEESEASDRRSAPSDAPSARRQLATASAAPEHARVSAEGVVASSPSICSNPAATATAPTCPTCSHTLSPMSLCVGLP
jgi:hypothetical protein